MKTKPLTFLFALTFLFLFSGSSVVFANDLKDGLGAYERKDYETAYKLLLPLAEQGNSKAQYTLGLMYETGREVPQDYKEAVKWYRLSAEQGDASAQCSLGEMYYGGEGVPQDYAEAIRLWKLAAEQGDEEAQYNLDNYA